ncbi:MAG: 16S rRNA (cytosine(1402)-N(4))-methyltransferase RsmH, partial [bacterium]|nr:16S rRNA (cytosine(1402)-N(4))-methyltransferase RsmH [bacterium]
SVLLNEVVEFLRAKEGGMFLDCTLGGGGHSQAILAAHPENKVLALDRDSIAIERAEDKFKKTHRIEFIKSNFSNVKKSAAGRKFNGILADLGMSTDQLMGARGFSFDDTGPLDMRMDSEHSVSANTVINEYSERDLFIAFKKGGVGNDAKNIARAIVNQRPINSSKVLAGIIREKSRVAKGDRFKDPATVVFQAIRIEVNGEFKEIETLLNTAPELLVNGSRLVIISFHSLEDKLVTRRFREWQAGDTAPAWMSAGAQKKTGLGKLLTSKAIVPSKAEILENPASRSALLRVFEFHD